MSEPAALVTLPDTIEIRRLRVTTSIGVPDEERANGQDLLVTVRMVPAQGFVGMADELSNTVDYHSAAMEVEALAQARPRRLIETLAVEIAEHLLREYPLSRVAVTVEKHILPQTECVAVHVERCR